MNTKSNFASTFAPYTPPPDDRLNSIPAAAASSSSRSPARPWFPPAQPDPSSYQSGALPTLGNSYGGGGSAVAVTGFGNQEADGPSNQWDSRFAMRVDLLAAFAYLLGPISALICLVLETHNDFVRFHAYQSALLTTPLALFRIFGALAHFPSFLNTLLTLSLTAVILFMAFRAYVDATRNNLSRFYMPYIGLLADKWVSEE